MKIRVYIDSPLETGDIFELPPKVFHHLVKVLRLSINSEFFVFNGQGGNCKARLISIEKKRAKAEINAFIADSITPGQRIHLAQAISRGDRMDFALQKAVELGVSEITPVFAENSAVKLPKERLQNKIRHWHEIMVSATEQCGRSDLPKLNIPFSFAQFVAIEDRHSCKIILDPHSEKSFGSLHQPGENILVMIGPESGFTHTEIALAQKNGFKSIKLGPRVLRTETAAIAAITTIQVLFGDII